MSSPALKAADNHTDLRASAATHKHEAGRQNRLVWQPRRIYATGLPPPVTASGSGIRDRVHHRIRSQEGLFVLALQLPFIEVSESMGNHDSKIVDAASVD